MAVLKETTCDIHTFDCTYNGTSKDPRHSYHKWCIGGSTEPGFRTWANITAELQHSKVDLLKMDIGKSHTVQERLHGWQEGVGSAASCALRYLLT
jgi:hypothetical protein